MQQNEGRMGRLESERKGEVTSLRVHSHLQMAHCPDVDE